MAKHSDPGARPAGQTICPRCGARDSFMKDYLRDTCVCRVCQSQLNWREIPGCGPDCTAPQATAGEADGAVNDAEGAADGGGVAANDRGAAAGDSGEAEGRRPTDLKE